MAMSRLGGSPDLKTQDKQLKYSIEFAGARFESVQLLG